MSFIDTLRERLPILMPLLLLALFLIANVVFCVVSVIPQWKIYSDLTARQSTYEEAIATQTADTTDPLGILQNRVDSAQTEVATVANGFITDPQSEGILNTLYTYAQESGVVITNMQAQQAQAQPVDAGAYSVKMFRLQANGSIPQLIDFMTRLREATLAPIEISEVSIAPDSASTEHSNLTISLLLYTSPYASGEALAQLPTQSPTPSAQATPTPIAALDATSEPLPSPEATPTLDLALCPNAPSPMIQVDSFAVVDFNGVGALRILPEISPYPMNAIVQAYDNDILKVVGGPKCGLWERQNVWYWQVQFAGMIGWAAEASAEDRWICPILNPECAP